MTIVAIFGLVGKKEWLKYFEEIEIFEKLQSFE